VVRVVGIAQAPERARFNPCQNAGPLNSADDQEMHRMPYKYSWPDNTFLAEFSGTTTAREIAAVNHAFSGDPRIDSVRYSVWDFSQVTMIDMSRNEIEEAAAFDKGLTYTKRHLKGALIAVNDQVRTQIETYMAAAQSLDVSWDTRIFDKLEVARAWLEAEAS
jgi:hypothetical protein